MVQSLLPLVGVYSYTHCKMNSASEIIPFIKCQETLRNVSELHFSFHWNHSRKFFNFFFLHKITLALFTYFLQKAIYQYV